MKELKFIHITKCAGTSIENLGKKKNILWGRFHKEYGWWHGIFTKKPLRLKSKYDWFIVVRNPYERILSEYYCKYGGPSVRHKNVQDFNNYLIDRIQKRGITRRGDHYTEQYVYLDSNCTIHVIKFENLKQDFDNLMVKYNLPLQLNIHSNKGEGVKTFQVKDFSNDLIKLINKVYSKDFEIFNYQKISVLQRIK